jgi:hypothetical protein
VPPPLTVAASLAAFEGIVLVIQGLTQVPGLHDEKLAMNATALLFFTVYGGFLLVCAWQLYRLHSWARAPVVLAQLIQILTGASFWGGATTVVAVASILVALVTLAGIFHPASLAALDSSD